jgi:hypothetical protein
VISLNNVTTADAYSGANTRLQPLTERLDLQVYNKAVYLQVCDDQGNFGTDETFFTPGKYSLEWRCGGARVRSAAVAVPAQVTFTLLTGSDLGSG